MKNNINKLLGLKNPSNAQISRDTGIAQMTLSDYSRGISKIGNMKLDHAIKLNNYYVEVILMEELNIDEKEITQAKEEFNSWSGDAAVWIDFVDGAVWTDVEDIPSYHDDSIYAIIGKDDMIDPNMKVSVSRLVRLASLKKEYLDNGESDLLINSLDINDIK